MASQASKHAASKGSKPRRSSPPAPHTKAAKKKTGKSKAAKKPATKPTQRSAQAKPKKSSARPASNTAKAKAKRRPLRILGAAFAALIALGIGIFAALYIALDIPDPEAIALASQSTVYCEDGATKLGTFGDYDRTPVSLDAIADDLEHAVVASEDRSFYTNNGISLRGMARAFLNNLRGGARQGGSTLTQQYVERYYLGQTTSYSGKLREAILALKIDRVQTKEQILENYLNTIYYGRGAYGIEEAAQKYFGIPASRLNLSQSAMLAGIIPAPSAWDPAVDPQMARERFERVLSLMEADGYISAADHENAAFPATIAVEVPNEFTGTNGYILAAIRDELVASAGMTPDELGQAGLTIISTIDADMQEAAVAAVNALPADRPDNNYVGLVAMDPANGEVRALYGGADYGLRQQNSAIQDHAQAGSTFKPFALAAALEQKVSLNKALTGASSKRFGDITVANADGKGYGTVSLLNATRLSVNTAYVQLNEEIGPAATMKAAIAAGLPESTPGLEANLTNVLGSASPTAWDMARAYGTFAAEGTRHEPHLVRTATDGAGALIYEGPSEGTEVFNERVSQRITYALRQVTAAGGTGATAGKLGRPVAGKTGTSSGPWSAWFCGYVPQLVAVVDMYQVGPNGEEEKLESFGKYANMPLYGSTYPVEVWLDFMKAATADMEIERFAQNTLY